MTSDIFKSADYARGLAKAKDLCGVQNHEAHGHMPSGEIFKLKLPDSPGARGAREQIISDLIQRKIDERKLPVEMADWWYKFAYSIPKESTETVLPVFLTGAFMMERHPKFFHRDTVMTGPCALFHYGAGDKIAETAKTLKFLSVPIGDPRVSFSGLLESIQDSISCERLLGAIVRPLTEACDLLAADWTSRINRGNTIGPYIPMQIKREDDRLVFSSRFAEWNK